LRLDILRFIGFPGRAAHHRERQLPELFLSPLVHTKGFRFISLIKDYYPKCKTYNTQQEAPLIQKPAHNADFFGL
jgi:hypothetical protein